MAYSTCMRNLTRLIIAALASCPVLVSAQTPPPVDSFQIRFQSGLQIGQSMVIITPTPAASPAAKASVAPAVNPPSQALTTTAPTLGAIVAPTDTGTNTFGKNIPIEGSQVNKPPTSAGTTTFDKNVPIEGAQVNKPPTGTGTGTTTFRKNIPIEGSQVNKTPTSTGTGTFTPGKNITIENSQFQNNAAVGNTTGSATHTATASHLNSKRNVTEVGQTDGERSKKKKKQQQIQEPRDEGQPMDRTGESRKKQKQQHQRQSDQPPE